MRWAPRVRLVDDLSRASANERAAIAAMLEGLRHLTASAPDAARALACFERALAWREQPYPGVSPWRQYDLAGTWINIAAARMQLGDAVAAEAACDTALGLLHMRPLEDFRVLRRRAVAHHTRGKALQMRQVLVEAGAAFDAAIATLEGAAAGRIPDRDYLLAVSWVSRAETHADATPGDGHSRAVDAARRALDLVRDFEASDERAAEVGLLARHVCCRAVAGDLARGLGQASVPDGPVHLATDAADDGLALVRGWEHRGVTRFRRIAGELYRFGGGVYARYQPQFLDEYIRDHADIVPGPIVVPR